jgi:putative tryptophan/tyrosine transport system substrate-binding protein
MASWRVSEIAVAFAQQPVDLILTAGDGQVVAAKKATDAIPIVFAATGDPVGNGLVASLANPGGERDRPENPRCPAPPCR